MINVPALKVQPWVISEDDPFNYLIPLWNELRSIAKIHVPVSYKAQPLGSIIKLYTYMLTSYKLFD